jgi:hypothetical protein
VSSVIDGSVCLCVSLPVSVSVSVSVSVFMFEIVKVRAWSVWRRKEMKTEEDGRRMGGGWESG